MRATRALGVLGGAGAGIALAAWWWSRPAVPSAAEREAAARIGPNVVLVIGCTVRADQTSPYGGPAEATPFLTALARDGTRFHRLIAAAPWTRPASVALITGRDPGEVGISESASARNDRALPDAVTTLAETLGAAGWRTVGITTNPNLNEVFGMAQGFDHYVDTGATWREGAEALGGREAVDAALGLVTRGDRARPFYLQVLLTDAHAPRRVSRAEVAAFSDPAVPASVARYRAALHRFDAAVARLDAGLRARGHGADDTVFVVAGDHGEGLRSPAHHGAGHGAALYPSTVEVPWLLRGPGVSAHHEVLGLASGVDVAPTLLGLVGVAAPEGMAGSDWSAQARGAVARTTREAAATATWFHVYRRGAVYREQRFCQRDHSGPGLEAYEQRRALRRGARPDFPDGCFDLESDPDARHPYDDPEALAEVDAWWALQDAWVGAGGAPSVTLDADLAKQLEALGYLEE